MSRIFQVTTFRTEDYPAEERKWIPRLLTPLNLFVTNVTQLLNGRLTFVNNIPAQDIAFDFTYAGTPQQLAWSIPLQPKILWIGQAYQGTTAIAVAFTWSFNASTSIVSINFLNLDGTSLTLGQNYKIYVRIVP